MQAGIHLPAFFCHLRLPSLQKFVLLPPQFHEYHSCPMTTDEKRAKGIPLSDIKPSQHRRASWKKYREPGLYMVTIAIEGRAPLFGELAGHFRAAPGTPEFPHLVPSALGRLILEQELPKIHHFYPQVEVWKAALMPDHMHLLLRVTATLPRGRHLGDVISSFKGGCSRAWWSLQESAMKAGQEGGHLTEPNGPATAAKQAGENPTGEKKAGQEGDHLTEPNGPATTAKQAGENPAGTKKAEVAAPSGAVDSFGGAQRGTAAPTFARHPLFEEGYHDRIIRRPGMLETIKRYMDDNPLRAVMRRQLPRLMERRLHLRIGTHEYAAFGALFLVKRSEKTQVFFHRRDKETGLPTEQTDAYKKQKAALLEEAREGVVLVSPGISKGEYGVINRARDEGLPVIHLQKEPIGPYWKPERGRFEACAKGQYLILAPWGLDEEIGRSSDYARFHKLNELAAEICATTDVAILEVSQLT